MAKYLLLGLAACMLWIYSTESGRNFYADYLFKSQVRSDAESKVVEPPAYVPDERVVQRLKSRLDEIDGKILGLQFELKHEQEMRASGVRSFRTDPIFLERMIGRHEDERKIVARDLERALTGN
ncbi:hypothetical protein FEM03_09530 [Phragmitibacter flavus]|uniref:Uncharacterized protein n=2 Tax=Phragmitibacter flavus TaxID=2576071 RepID=A0A5R8KFY2_9BACT|nr:hypothetical protein FEM03_09530 [Phragmitibacter flavus]